LACSFVAEFQNTGWTSTFLSSGPPKYVRPAMRGVMALATAPPASYAPQHVHGGTVSENGDAAHSDVSARRLQSRPGRRRANLSAAGLI
jgi:hypothetical protein